MAQTVEAIYENGVLKPLSSLKLREHIKVRLVIEEIENIATATSGIITPLRKEIIDEIALAPEFLPEEA